MFINHSYKHIKNLIIVVAPPLIKSIGIVTKKEYILNEQHKPHVYILIQQILNQRTNVHNIFKRRLFFAP